MKYMEFFCEGCIDLVEQTVDEFYASKMGILADVYVASYRSQKHLLQCLFIKAVAF